MIRAIIIGGAAGGCIGLIGYNVEIMLREKATSWTYILAICGFVGLVAVWWYVQRLRK